MYIYIYTYIYIYVYTNLYDSSAGWPRHPDAQTKVLMSNADFAPYRGWMFGKR